MNSKQAIIVGAGPAGLTAAYYLLKETDIRPIILEAENQVGGISKTIGYHGNLVDLGGHRFFSKSEEITKIWEELCPVQSHPAKDDALLGVEHKQLNPKGLNPEENENVFLIRDRVSRIFFRKKFFDYPISIKPQTFINMGFVNTVKAGIFYVYSAFFKRKENSLEDFYINRFGKALYGMFFENYTEKLWGVHPRNISPNWGRQRVKGLSLSKAIINAIFKPKKKETSLIESFCYPKRGCGQMWELMAQKVLDMGGKIILNAPVVRIETEKNKIQSVVAKIDNQEQVFVGDYYFSSMAIKDFANCVSEIPNDIKELAVNLPYRDFMTVAILVPELKIKNKTKIKTLNHLIPDTWVYVQDPSLKMCRFQLFNNWSPYMVNDFPKSVWMGLEYVCDEKDDLWKKSDAEFIQFAINELDSIGVIDKKDVLDAVRIKIKKAYPAYFGVYDQFDTVKNYLNTFDNLYCVGRNGQHRYNNMDHSMLTAICAVRSILGQCKKEDIWNVNTEESYHEEKQ